MEHDKCRRTKKYIYAGQNLAMSWCTPHISPDEAIKRANENWWKEYKNITFINEGNLYNSIKANDKHGHFTQMARDKAFAIGCAMISTRNGYEHYIACNYALANIINQPVYERGPVASGCKTKNKKYPGLCGKYEDYRSYKKNRTKYFTKDNTTVPPLKQWIANGKMLIGKKKASHRHRKK